jgi:hypothetical protein
MLRKKLKGGALYMALIISIVTGIILSSFIFIGHYNQRQVISHSISTQLQLNLESGVQMAQSETFSKTLNNKWQKIYFNDDSIRIKKLQWGAYNIINVETKKGKFSLRQNGLYGTYSLRDTSMIIADNGRPLAAAGRIKLNGNAYVPKGLIKSVVIDGQSFIADGNLKYFLKSSNEQIPELSKNFKSDIKSCVSEINSNTDSLVSFISPESKNSFSAKTIVFQNDYINLNNCVLTGNIKLIGRSMVIENNAQLENILIVSSKVHIRKGYRGTIHVIAQDSIIVDDDCVLLYPSSLTLLKTGKTNVVSGIFIGDKCKIEGSIISFSEVPSSDSEMEKLAMSLGKDCEIAGLLYTTGYAQIQGKISGSIICQNLLVKTPSSAFENHLLATDIDPKKYGSSIIIPSILTNMKDLKTAKWF